MTAARTESPAKSHCPRRHLLLISLVTVIWFLCSHAASGGAPGFPSESQLTESVRKALPTGWSISDVKVALPPGWVANDPSAVVISVNHGHGTGNLSFVPVNWIGVQTRGGPIDTVRLAAQAKIIVGPATFPATAWLEQLAPTPASLASPLGDTASFAGQFAAAEAEIRTLLRKQSSTREPAVASFVALGVPAEDLIRQAALDPRHPARLVAVRALGCFPGKATREALLKIITDRSRDSAADTVRLAAIESCERLGIDIHGRAVLTALQMEKDEGTALRLAEVVNRLRVGQAAPELRRWLKSAKSAEARVVFARALATLRADGAAQDIQNLMTAPTARRAAVASSGESANRDALEIEHHRLVGTWGPAVRGVRLSLAAQSPDRVLIYLENMGESPFLYVPITDDNGKAWPIGLRVSLDGRWVSPAGPGSADLGPLQTIARQIAPGTAARFELRLAEPLPPGAERNLTATWFDLVANEVALRTLAAK